MEKSNELNNPETVTPEAYRAQTDTSQQPVDGTTQQQPLEPTLPQKTGKKWLIPSLIGLVIIAVGIAGYFIYEHIQLKSGQFGQGQVTPTPTNNTAVPTIDPTAKWKLYKNTKYNYQIKYPNDWTAKSTGPGPHAFDLVDNSRGIITYPNIYSGVADAKTYITIETDGPQNLAYSNYEDWLKSVSSAKFYTIESTTQETFADVPATVVTGSYDGYGFPATIKTIHFKSPDNSTYFSVTVTDEKGSSRDSVVDQILATFSFVSLADTATNPKTYTDDLEF